MLILRGGLVSCRLFKQRCVAASTMEGKSIFILERIQRVHYHRRVLQELINRPNCVLLMMLISPASRWKPSMISVTSMF